MFDKFYYQNNILCWRKVDFCLYMLWKLELVKKKKKIRISLNKTGAQTSFESLLVELHMTSRTICQWPSSVTQAVCWMSYSLSSSCISMHLSVKIATSVNGYFFCQPVLGMQVYLPLELAFSGRSSHWSRDFFSGFIFNRELLLACRQLSRQIWTATLMQLWDIKHEKNKRHSWLKSNRVIYLWTRGLSVFFSYFAPDFPFRFFQLIRAGAKITDYRLSFTLWTAWTAVSHATKLFQLPVVLLNG